MQDKHYRELVEHWLEKEPLLLKVLCGTGHKIVENTTMFCAIRSGAGRIEINPSLTNRYQFNKYEEVVKAEMLRLLLKHPYSRRPEDCSRSECAQGSTMVLGDCYRFKHIRMNTPADYGLSSGMNYEWYARQVEETQEGEGKGEGDEGEGNGEKYRDLAELWEEDDMTAQLINGIIESTKSWGSISGKFAEMLNASLKAKINWRNIFAGFRASIISAKRKLTRMRPNRRTGFANMGSIRRFDTKLLVAVDVSGSISTKSLQYFYGVINSAFRYGFESIDVIQFDCGVQLVHSLKKVIKDVAVLGRGGTSFQEPIEYAHENGYDGLIILTDGYAPAPRIPEGFKTGILWVCENEDCLEQHKSWMEKSGRTCVMQIG